MQDEVKAIVSRLHATRLLDSEDKARRFDRALMELESFTDFLSHETLQELLGVFSDECEMHEVMWGLVHFIESFFTADEEAAELIRNYFRMSKEGAHEWADLLLMRLVNSAEGRAALAANLGSKSAPSSVVSTLREWSKRDDATGNNVRSILA